MPPPTQSPHLATRRRYQFLLLIFSTAITILILLIAIIYNANKPKQTGPPDFLDSKLTAAHSNLLAIASQFVGDPYSETPAAYVTKNKAAIAALHRALEHPIEAPPSFDSAMPARRLATALMTEAKHAENEKRFRDAANIYFDTLRLGDRLQHGQLLFHTIGCGVQEIALRRLNPILTNLTNADLAELAPATQSLNRNRLTYEEIERREQYFNTKNVTNVVDAIKYELTPGIRGFNKKSKDLYFMIHAEVELTAAAMAALRYTRENQTPLTNLRSLIPKYLKTLPIDPYSEAPLRLLPSTNAVPILYSVGPNQRDNQSKGDDLTGPAIN